MNVLFVSNDPNLAIEQSKVRRRFDVYAKYAPEVIVITRARKKVVHKRGTLTVYVFSEPAIVYLLLLPLRIHRLITENNISVISSQDPFEYGFLALLGRFGTKAQLHVQLHTDPFSQEFDRGGLHGLQNYMRRILLRITLPRASSIRVVSKRLARHVSKYAPHVRVEVLPVWIQEMPRASMPEKIPLSFITIGRLTTEKNISDIISAFSVIAQEYKDVRLTVVGDGPLRNTLTAYVKRYRIDSQVEFISHVSEVAPLLSAHEVYIHASSYEGSGLTLIEAGLMGLTIFTTDVGIVGDVLTDKYSVRTYKTHDVQGLISLMRMHCTRTSDFASLGAHAQKSVREHLASYTDLPKMIMNNICTTV